MKKKCLTHYTTLENAISILQSGAFRFSRLRDMNDLQESVLELYYPSLTDFFSCSFVKSTKENIPMWKIYGQKKTNSSAAVMIKFILKDGVDYCGLFKDKKLRCQEIKYIKPRLYNKYARGEIVIPNNELGFLKSSYWSFENEFRFGTNLNGQNNCYDLDFDNIDAIKIFVYKNQPNIIGLQTLKKIRLNSLKANKNVYDKISFKKSYLVNITP